VLNDLDIEYWVDDDIIDEGNPIPREIDNGLSSSTHFFLLWSKAASGSNYVRMETDTVLSPPYLDRIKKIPFILDETPLPHGFASIPYHRISIDNAEKETKKVLNKIRADLEFSSQLNLFRDTVCEHYENLPPKPDIPVITNFRKFDGYKYYVQQRYTDPAINKTGREIVG